MNTFLVIIGVIVVLVVINSAMNVVRNRGITMVDAAAPKNFQKIRR